MPLKEDSLVASPIFKLVVPCGTAFSVPLFFCHDERRQGLHGTYSRGTAERKRAFCPNQNEVLSPPH